ncbi:MAG: pilus assembly protein PilM [Nitrospirae bacterium GWD2_57_9]|nr:MAG: pilus assembly protein PilM [Nitrospirae bacterium GWD2_57_9]
MFFSKSADPIALDIGSTFIKLVQLKGSKGQYHLVKFGMVPLPPEVIVEGAVMDAGRVVDAIKELLASQQVKTKEVVLSVSGSSVIIKRIAVADMTEEELAESIKWEAEQYIPFSIDDVNVDFQKLGQGAQEGQADVLLVAVKKDKINDYVNLVKEAGLEPVVLDVDAFALANMYELNYEQEAGITALFNIGASVMNINILKDGTSIFTRDITVGGNRYTEALQREFGLTYEDAEKVKRGESVDGAEADQIAGVMSSVTEDIVAETQRSLDFFRSTTGSEQVSRVLVSGGCARIGNFTSVLGERIEIPVEITNPFKNIKIDPKRFNAASLEEAGPQSAVAVGLAIRRPGDR